MAKLPVVFVAMCAKSEVGSLEARATSVLVDDRRSIQIVELRTRLSAIRERGHSIAVRLAVPLPWGVDSLQARGQYVLRSRDGFGMEDTLQADPSGQPCLGA